MTKEMPGHIRMVYTRPSSFSTLGPTSKGNVVARVKVVDHGAEALPWCVSPCLIASLWLFSLVNVWANHVSTCFRQRFVPEITVEGNRLIGDEAGSVTHAVNN